MSDPEVEAPGFRKCEKTAHRRGRKGRGGTQRNEDDENNGMDFLRVLEACPELVEGSSAVKRFCIFSHLLQPGGTGRDIHEFSARPPRLKPLC
jgi:hypothetical protein